MTDRSAVEASELPSPLPPELRRAESRSQLGVMLLRDGHLTAGQLEEALAEKESRGGRLGEILVEHGWVTGAVVAEALAEQHGLEFLDAGQIHVDPAALSLLPEKLARRYEALPIRFLDQSTVLIAVADPTNVLASDDLRLALGLNVKLAVAAGPDLLRTLSRVYRTQMAVEEAPEQLPELNVHLADDVREGSSGNAPAIKLVNSLLARAIEEGASDIHFEPQANGLIVRARIDGVTRRVAEVPKSLQPAVTSRLKIMGELDIAERRTPQDGRVSIRFGGTPMDLRIAILPTTYGEKVALRILHRATGRLGLAELGLSPGAEAVLTRAISQPFGAVIACGPTGSGKTTTLYAALDFLNDEGRVLTTIEDPVEYQIPGTNQVEVNTRSGLTFARGLRTILRSDPDVLLVGEIRDEETARIAIQAAMTGHLVLSSLHTHNAASSIARLKDMGVEPGLLATSLNCIVAQRLARRLCIECREPYTPDGGELAGMGMQDAEGETLYRSRGGGHCAATGYSGRVALYEVLPAHGRVRRLVEASTEEIFAAAVEDGMTTLREDGMRLCRAGISSIDEIRRVTGDRLA